MKLVPISNTIFILYQLGFGLHIPPDLGTGGAFGYGGYGGEAIQH